MSMPPAERSRRFMVARVLLLIWFLYVVTSTVLLLPAKYQSWRSLETVNETGTTFQGWSTDQVHSILDELGMRAEMVAATRLATSLVSLLCFWVVGVLLWWKRSGSRIGLLAAFVLMVTGPGFSDLLRSQTQQLAPWATAVDDMVALLIWPTFFLILYLFPNGRFVPQTTRYLAPLPYLLFFSTALLPNSGAVEAIGMPLLLIYASGGLLGQVYRYRRVSTPEERQQTKWVVLALAIFLATVLAIQFAPALFPALVVGTPARFWFDFLGNGVLGVLVPALLPLALGISILRYRLWDIDVIIRKTAVYVLLSGLLGLVYLGGVVLLESAFGTVRGGQSPTVIVISTLVIALLFAPLRRRVQALIDRRFFRRRYDAQQVLAEFADTAREEVSLEVLAAELLRVVEETMQPEVVALWLKD
jgi:hypothetical protein